MRVDARQHDADRMLEPASNCLCGFRVGDEGMRLVVAEVATALGVAGRREVERELLEQCKVSPAPVARRATGHANIM